MSSSPIGTEHTQHRVLSASRVRGECIRLGFDLVGFTDVRASEHESFLREWLEAGRHGEMAYMAREDAVERRVHMDTAHPGLRSAIVLGINYCNDAAGVASRSAHADGAAGGHDTVANDADASRGIIARYARGRDYHKVIRKKLIALLRWIEEDAGMPLPLARACVDTSPVLERELARRAGLGWFGRSAMLVNPARGSYFFLATLLVELDVDQLDTPFERDHCGTCNACVSACPTGALLGRDENGAPVIDATRCISYLTIENRGEIPLDLRPLIGNRIFGCDICQEVCPFTQKFSTATSEPAFAARGPGEPPFGVQLQPGAARPHPGTTAPSLIALLEIALDPAAWDAFTRGSALRRAGPAGLARNICVALGNWGSPEAVPVLMSALADTDPLVRGHAVWALGRISSPSAVSALEVQAARESDASVLEEISTALSS